MHGDRKTVGDDLERRGRRIFKAQFPWPLDEDLAFGAFAVGANLNEIASHIGGGIKIGIGLLDSRQRVHRNEGRRRLGWRAVVLACATAGLAGLVLADEGSA